MSYLTEAFHYIVPNYYYHTNNSYMVIADDYQVDKLTQEKINEPTINCVHTNRKKIQGDNTYIRVSPTVSINNFPQLPNMGCSSDLERQRGRGANEPIFTANGPRKYCSEMTQCTKRRK